MYFSRALAARRRSLSRKIGRTMRTRILVMAGLLALVSHRALADDVSATAKISDAETEVGQAVDFQIQTTGGDARVPENIAVDGLSITYTGQSTQTQINFGTVFGSSGSHMQTLNTYTYSVVPQRAGSFTIPALQVEVNGQQLATKPVNLNVGGSTAQNSTGKNDLYFAQLIIPKTTAYIGEAVPAEIKIYVDGRIAAQLAEAPDIAVDSCTMQPLTKPQQTQVERNGRVYAMVTYKTALTPVKAGTLKIGPVKQECLARIPQKRRRGGGPFGNPMFDDPFFDDAFTMMGPPQKVTIETDSTNLEVKPLPSTGQPESFAGAVGQYTMTTTVKPTMVEAGDPITVTARIAGRGNFDRVSGPQLTDPRGWRVYPPTAKFSQDDDLGISGVKTFDMAAVPQEGKTAAPELKWSYFDPDKEQYVTLTGSSVPIKVEGQIAAAPTPAISTPANTTANAAPTPGAPDIMYIRADSGGWGETFEPLYASRVFWMAQAVPLLALLGFIGLHVRAKRAADLPARRRAEWRREKDAAMDAARRRGVPEAELYERAAWALRLEAAAQMDRAPDTLHAAEVLGARALGAETAERVRRLFERQAEALYAGSSSGARPASAEAQADVLDLIKKYEGAKSVS